MRRILPAVALWLMTALGMTSLTSCDNSGNSNPGSIIEEWGNYMGLTADRATFEVQRTGNGPTYTLISSRAISGMNMQPGTRVLFSYEVTNVNSLPTTGEIDLVACAQILTCTPRVVDMDTVADWNQNALYVQFIARTGGYLNLMARAYVDPSGLDKTFTFYVDRRSLETSNPRLYLRYNKPANVFNEGLVPMSLDVRTLWSQTERFDGVTLHVNNDNMPTLSVLDFPRSADNYVQP